MAPVPPSDVEPSDANVVGDRNGQNLYWRDAVVKQSPTAEAT